MTTTRLLPKIETKTVEMPTRGRKWTEEPAIPDRTANDEEERGERRLLDGSSTSEGEEEEESESESESEDESSSEEEEEED